MEFFEALEAVKKHEKYENHRGKLVHGFTTVEKDVWTPWQVGFYNTDNDTITPFTVSDTVEIQEAQEVFKQKENIIPLIVSDVQIGKQDAIRLAHNYLEENHIGHNPTKSIILLQHLPEGQMYNITVVTSALHMLNIRIDAKTAKILSTDFHSLMELGSME